MKDTDARWAPIGIGPRLRKAREWLGMTQQQLAETLRCTQAFVSAVESGRSLPGIAMTTLLERQGISESWLLTGEGDMTLLVEEPASVVRDGPMTSRPLRILGNVPAGHPGLSPVEEQIEGYFPVPWEMTGDRDAFCLRIDGESMAGVLEAGDLVVVSPGLRTRIKNGDLVVVRIEPEATYVKRWMRSGNQVILLSANSKYPPIVVGAEETAIVIGKVVCIIHKCK